MVTRTIRGRFTGKGGAGLQLPDSTDASLAVGAYPTFLGGNAAPVVQAYYASKCGPAWSPVPPPVCVLCPMFGSAHFRVL